VILYYKHIIFFNLLLYSVEISICVNINTTFSLYLFNIWTHFYTISYISIEKFVLLLYIIIYFMIFFYIYLTFLAL